MSGYRRWTNKQRADIAALAATPHLPAHEQKDSDCILQRPLAFSPAMTGNQIKKLRESLGYTMDEFAYALGYRNKQRASTISRWESGDTNPPPPAVVLMQQLQTAR